MTLFKKTLALLLCLVMALSVVACGGGDDAVPTVDLDAIEETMAEGDKNCVHVWGDWEDFEEATCTTEGLAIRTCEICGKQESQKLAAYGHDVSSGKCMECGKKIKKCDHEDTEIVVIKAATCTEKGKENEVCSECFTILDEDKTEALGHSMKYYDYKDATCTEIGWYSHEACENCGQNNREEIQPYGHNMAAGTCSVCAYVDSSFEFMTAPGMTEVSTTITAPQSVVYTGVAATINTETAEFTKDDEVHVYSLNPAVNGYYRIWVSEVYSGNELNIHVKDSLGQTVSGGQTWYGVGNNSGVTVQLTAGQSYTVEIKQYTGLFTYQLNCAHQKASVDISTYDVINDSIQFTDQAIAYTFTPTTAGNYRFEFSGMMADMQTDIYIYDRLGYETGYARYCNNGEGVTVSNFVVGDTYTIIIYERSQYGNFTLNIRKPTASVDVSNYNTVYDSIAYGDQTNTYTFTATSTRYSVMINGMTEGIRVKMYLYDSLGNEKGYDSKCYNGDSFSVTDLVVGEVYTVKVMYRDGATPYALRIYTGKDPVAVSSNMGIQDAIEFNGQVNTYNLTVDVAGPHEIMMAMVETGGCFSVAVYDANGTLIAEDYYMYAGDSFSIGDLAVGDQLTITVTHYSDRCGYTLAIQ